MSNNTAEQQLALAVAEAMWSRDQAAQALGMAIVEVRPGERLPVDGEVVDYSLARIPVKGETRGNLAAGGSGVAMPLTDIERQVAQVVAPIVKEKGLMFDGLDLIGGRITEINVTSPTCVREIDDQCGTDIATDFIIAIEKKLAV